MNKKYAKIASNHMSQLYVFASIVGILESGSITSISASAAKKITAICNKEQSRHLRLYDKAVENIKETP